MSCVTEATCPDGYRELSTDELHELLRDDNKMELIIRLNDKFQELQLDRESLLSSNRGLAELSLTQRPRLDSGKLRLSEKYRELSDLASSCSDKQSRLEARGQVGSLQSAHYRLQEEVARAEEESEELLERFMDGALPLEDFLDSFHRSRRTCHTRRVQADKLQELRAREGHRPTADQSRTTDPPKDEKRDSELDPNGLNNQPPQAPLRVFQVRYGLTPAILVPHYPPVSSPAPAAPPSSGQAPAVGLRLIGQLPGGWNGRPVRVQQLYRPGPPPHAEPSPGAPCR